MRYKMKTVFLISILSLLSFSSSAQFEFEADTTKVEVIRFGFPNMDSIQFELRLWTSSDILSGYTQLTFSQGGWNYRTGFLDDNRALKEFSRMDKEPNLQKLWNKIDSLGILTLQSQGIVGAKFESKTGRVFKLPDEDFESMMGSAHGVGYTVELFSDSGYRTYYYFNPLELSEYFKDSELKWIAPEHHRFAEIIRLMNETLNLNEGFKEFVKEWVKDR